MPQGNPLGNVVACPLCGNTGGILRTNFGKTGSCSQCKHSGNYASFLPERKTPQAKAQEARKEKVAPAKPAPAIPQEERMAPIRSGVKPLTPLIRNSLRRQ